MDRVVELCTQARTKKIDMSLYNQVSTHFGCCAKLVLSTHSSHYSIKLKQPRKKVEEARNKQELMTFQTLQRKPTLCSDNLITKHNVRHIMGTAS